jgi:PAS domain S-box-containing protein
MSRTPETNPNPGRDLRERAEAAWQARHRDFSAASQDDVVRLLHELEVHQIELELKNEELRYAQIELEESRQQFSDLYDFAPVGYLTIGQDTVIAQANLTAATMLGVERLHLVGQRFSRFLQRQSQDALYQWLGATGSSVPSRSGELLLHKANGVTLPVSMEMAEVVGSSPPAWRCVIMDITEHKKAEAVQHRLHQLAMMSLDTGKMEDLLGAVLKTAMTITQADFGNIQLLEPGSSDLRIAAQRGFPQWWIDYWQTVAKGQGTCGTALERGERVIVEDIEHSQIFSGTAFEIQRKAGVRAVQSTPLVSRSGNPIGMFSTHYKRPHRPDERTLELLDLLAHEAADIIEHKQAENERARLLEAEQEARAAADAANRSKDVFLATVSHELRTPLNSMMGWAQMFREGILPSDRVPHAIASINRTAEVMKTLVEDLFEMSRLATGNLQLNREYVDIVLVVQESLNLLESSANAKNIRLEIYFESEPMMVHADPNRLRQILWNLLSNAIKFTPPEGLVALHLRSIAKEVEIRVVDSGQGIAPEFAPQVFEPFAQGTGGGKGLGLGLAIVRQLVTAHGGRISVTSPGVGQGATFTVVLPMLAGVPA